MGRRKMLRRKGRRDEDEMGLTQLFLLLSVSDCAEPAAWAAIRQLQHPSVTVKELA
jgi:hypothetical protein